MQKLRDWLREFKEDESGVIMVITTLVLVALLSVTALVVDQGLIYYEKSSLQTALDSAALAAASKLPDTAAAELTARDYVEKNGFDSTNVVVTFPSNSDIVRVAKVLETDTIFARFFGQTSVTNSLRAAARRLSKSSSMDFPYLFFQNDPGTQTMLGGHFTINGNVHSNASLVLGPSTSSRVYGEISCGGSYTLSTGTGVIDPNSVHPYASQVQMPDYDSSIMDLVYEAGFCIPKDSDKDGDTDEWPATWNNWVNNQWPKYWYQGYRQFTQDTFYSVTEVKQKQVKYGTKNVRVFQSLFDGYILPNYRCTTNFNQPWVDTTLYGSLRVDGDCTFNCSMTIFGDLYVTGNLTLGGGSWLFIAGNVYCSGSINLTGGTSISAPVGTDDVAEIEEWVDDEGYSRYHAAYPYPNPASPASSFEPIGIWSSSCNELWQGYSVVIGGDIIAKESLTISGGVAAVVGYENRWHHPGGQLNVLDYDNYDSHYVFSGGDMTISGALKLERGVVYSGGNFKSAGSSLFYVGKDQYNNNITASNVINGVIISEGSLELGGMISHINGNGNTSMSLYSRHGDIKFYQAASGAVIYGMVYAPEGTAELGSGNYSIYGSVIANKLKVGPGGLTIGENDRTLPFSSAVMLSALIE